MFKTSTINVITQYAIVIAGTTFSAKDETLLTPPINTIPSKIAQTIPIANGGTSKYVVTEEAIVFICTPGAFIYATVLSPA